jgi:hypothetical protein
MGRTNSGDFTAAAGTCSVDAAGRSAECALTLTELTLSGHGCPEYGERQNPPPEPRSAVVYSDEDDRSRR